MSDTGAASPRTPMRLLIDSNFYITLEPYGGTVESGQRLAADVVRLVSEQGHKLLVHPATRDDLLCAPDPDLRKQRLAELHKYAELEEGPVPAALTAILGTPSPGSNDDRDMRILAAMYNNAAAYLITNDVGMRKRAARVGLADRVLTITDAAEMLQQLTPAAPSTPPRVRSVAPYALDADQPIFESLREDYPGFDEWLNRKVRADPDNRDCLVIEEDGKCAALAIVKRVEVDCAYGFPQPVTKVATFKVDTDFVGSKYGELLLKSLFVAAHERGAASMYVEVLPKHEGLVDMLARFGFATSKHVTGRGELVMVKHRRPSPDADPLPALQHHVTYGPPAIRGTGSVFLVPILPVWHRQLFPDAPDEPTAFEQLELMTDPAALTHPWGNALRKAYLSNSPSNQLRPGDTLLFYRSRGRATVTAVGVVEETLRSADPIEVMAFVERRTVYTPDEIAAKCRSVRGTLAILFRQDRFIDPPWNLGELQANRVATTWPQSITKAREGGTQWVYDRLNA